MRFLENVGQKVRGIEGGRREQGRDQHLRIGYEPQRTNNPQVQYH